MTDLERLELVLRRVQDNAKIQPFEASAEVILAAIINELTWENDRLAKLRARQPQ